MTYSEDPDTDDAGTPSIDALPTPISSIAHVSLVPTHAPLIPEYADTALSPEGQPAHLYRRS
ncbi:hypothetical protein EYE40_07895 [Glaciihabitans arcticus]|uniref:Uncharacterized protein n=1 Tax=Glaciihabitans arcticus TaxID=2668039 RepID=A0A4Q9GRY4_9MICO|nr:hypothetical protein [Glaciihabitans arcticus]TBN57325.1 hypothetical protein EYE40_07895 [Glaciihabitans arcticus]